MKKKYQTPGIQTIVFHSEPMMAASNEVSVYNTNADNTDALSNHRGIFDDPWDVDQEK